MNMLQDLFRDFIDFILYDILKKELPIPKNFSLDKLRLNFELHKEKGGLWVEARSYPGLVASGENLQELREAIFDSILTYFDVPRSTAKRLEDTLVLNLPDGSHVEPPLRQKLIEVKLAYS